MKIKREKAEEEPKRFLFTSRFQNKWRASASFSHFFFFTMSVKLFFLVFFFSFVLSSYLFSLSSTSLFALFSVPFLPLCYIFCYTFSSSVLSFSPFFSFTTSVKLFFSFSFFIFCLTPLVFSLGVLPSCPSDVEYSNFFPPHRSRMSKERMWVNVSECCEFVNVESASTHALGGHWSQTHELGTMYFPSFRSRFPIFDLILR